MAAAQVFYTVGYSTVCFPAKKISANAIPKYSSAQKDRRMVVFANSLVYLFKTPPSDEEIMKAYTGSDGLLISRILAPSGTYHNFWIFHFNKTFGFVGVEWDRLSRWLILFAYPIYCLTRGIFWLLGALHEIFR